MTARYQAEVNGRLRQITVHREDGRFIVTVDRRRWDVDATRVDAHKMSLLARLADPAQPALDRKADPTRSYEVSLAPDPATGRINVRIGTVTVQVSLSGRRPRGRKEEDGPASGPDRLTAPMPGKIVRVLVKTGDAVHVRQPIVVVEAMKMENELRARRDGMVTELPVADGQSVEAGTLLAVIS